MRRTLPMALLLSVTMAAGVSASPAPPLTPPEQARTLTRESTVTLHSDVDAVGGSVVLAQAVPAGAQYVPGSAADAQGQPVEVRVGRSGRLYFLLTRPGPVTFRVTHTGALGELPAVAVLRVAGDQTEVLSGSADLADLRAAVPQPASAPVRPDSAAGQVLLSPANGSVAPYGAVSVTVRSPAEAPLDLTVNGELVGRDRIGRSERSATSTLDTYVAVPLAPGPNVLRAGEESVTVMAPGAAARVRFKVLDARADGHTPVRIQVDVLDDRGTPVPLPQVTLNIRGAQPQTPDASPTTGGYQLALNAGQGVLTLRPTTQARIGLSAHGFPDEANLTLDVQVGTLAIIQGSVTVQPGADLGIWAQGTATVEAPVLGGMLRVNADSEGLQSPGETRQGLYGDASTPRSDLSARGPLSAGFEHPSASVRYAGRAAADSVFGVTYDSDGLGITIRSTPAVDGAPVFSVAGYVTQQASHQVTEMFADRGLSYRLGRAVQPGSETLAVTGTREGLSERALLTRGVDYTIVYSTGQITLTRALSVLQPGLLGAQLEVTYAGTGTSGQDTLWGASGEVAWGKFAGNGDQGGRVQAGFAQTAGGAAYGVRAQVSAPGADANARIMTQGGEWRGELQARMGTADGPNARVSLSAQTDAYTGPGKGTPGAAVDLAASLPLAPTFGVRAGVNYASGHRALADLLAVWTPVPDFSVAAGAGYDFTQGVPVVIGQVEYRPPFGLKIRHEQALGGVSTTTITGGLPLTDTLGVKVENQLTWTPEGPRHQGVIGLTGRTGAARYDLSYELPGSGGEQGRLRSAVSGEFPLTDHVTVGAQASLTYQPVLSGTLSADVRYRDDRTLASAAVDLTHDGEQFSAGLRTALTHSAGNWTLGAAGQSVFGVQAGHRYTASAAYRDGTHTWLSTASARSGTLGPDGGEIKLLSEYARSLSGAELRAGLGLLSDAAFGGLTGNLYVGGTYWLTDRFGVGAMYRYLTQQGESGVHGLGLEATGVLAPGLALTAGYNFTTYNAQAWLDARRGVYVRADVLIGGARR